MIPKSVLDEAALNLKENILALGALLYLHLLLEQLCFFWIKTLPRNYSCSLHLKIRLLQQSLHEVTFEDGPEATIDSNLSGLIKRFSHAEVIDYEQVSESIQRSDFNF